MIALLSFQAADWFTVTNHGGVAAIEGIPGLCPLDLMHRQVIDGDVYFVWGVDTHPVKNRREHSTGKAFGLGVWPV